MEKRKIKPKTGIILNFILTILGIILFIVGVFILIKGVVQENTYADVNAKVKTIIENDDERYIIVSFSVGENKYDVYYPYFDSTLDIGDVVSIKYNIKDPNKIIARKGGFYFSSIISIFIGIFLFLYNFLAIYSLKKEYERIEYLIKNGKKYEALIIAIEEDNKNTCFGHVPYIIACMLKLNEKTYNLVSKDIYIDANISGYVNHYIDVYTSDDEFTNYYIDYMKVR